MVDYWRILWIYAVRPNIMCAHPFLMVKILNPCPAELLLVIFITVPGLKIKPILPYKLKKVQTYPSQKIFTTYISLKIKCSRSPAAY